MEAALGLGTLTANDRYAPAVNNILAPGTNRGSVSPAPLTSAASRPAQAALTGTQPATTASTATAASAVLPDDGGFLSSAAAARQQVAWVTSYQDGTVSPVYAPISVGAFPDAVAVTG